MPTLATPAPTGRRSLRRLRWSQLDQWQRMAVSHLLSRHGRDEGVLEDHAAVTDEAERVHESHQLAADLHLDLAPAEEIAQCNWCLTVTGDEDVEEYEGRLYCAVDCLAEARAEDDAPPARLAA